MEPSAVSTPNDNLYNYRCQLIRIIDGDTVELDVDLGLETNRKIRCRLYGINAPKKNTAEGRTAAQWLTVRLARVKTLYVQTYKDKTEKYGRYLANLIDENSNSINTEMVTAGHAQEYFGTGQRP